MKKLFFLLLAAGLLVACSQDDVNNESVSNDTQVTLSFSPYEQEAMTRAATSISTIVTRLDVWIYESGSEVTAIHQSTSDADFGTITTTLDKTKTYTLYAVGHKGTAAATLADGVISFPDDKVTHSMYYTTTFSPATTTNLSCLMTRIVAMFQFKTDDECPANVAKMRFTLNNVYDRWSVTTGASHQLNRVSTFENFSKNNDGTVTFNLYAIVTDAQTLHTVTVEAFDSGDNEIQTKTFTDVPLRNGYKTIYHGQFFTDQDASAAFTVDDWNEYDAVTF